MEKNKEIGKAFREKLDQLDRVPSDALWSKIDSDLDSKQKKRPVFWFVPLWIVSGLLLGGLLYTFYLAENNSDPGSLQHKTVPGENQQRKEPRAEGKEASAEAKKAITEQEKASGEGKKAITAAKNTFTATKNAATSGKNTSTAAKNTITEQEKASGEGKKAITAAKNTFTATKNAATSGKNTSAAAKKALTERNGSKTTRSSSDKTVPYSETVRTVKKTKRLVKSTEEYDEYEVVQKYTYIVKKKKKNIRVPDKKPHFVTNKKKKTFSQTKPKNKQLPKTTKQPAEKTVPVLVGNEQKVAVADAKTDSVAVAPVVAVLPKIVPEKKEKKRSPEDSIPEEKEKKRLYITPYFSPTLYESFAKGNSVSSRYHDDPKKAVLTYSFGCYARWMFSPKVGSRLGIGKTNLEYTTNTHKSNNSVIDPKNINLAAGVTPATINATFENDTEVLLSQKLSYYEVPLEAYYVFSDRKIGMATAFGLSFLILDKNELTLQSNSVREYTIGSAKNILDQSVTGNVKFIFDYKLSDSFQLEASPSFQYHFLGFKNAPDFKPYIFSLQVGFSYKL
ncbi:hypothetical protein [Flavobacterium humi]|uniref:Outer membrane protein beta-barrel domain-containing protein n=1 Tax=Flavobacterium humi TaxID=2562683 RepID=A0A4Z0L4S9_9FLAO|nr:hypothetical protein [Flavobacterium humi]TGD56966.1 hypothetical protein E4635_14330 [Flavobacterium humi]